MKSLRDIFWSLSLHADKWDPYFDVYETWFSRFRGQAPRILEIGVQHGGSSRMWQEYFGLGTQIVGVDIDPRCLQHKTNNIDIVIGDQGNPDFWNQFLSQYTEPFDIIIDDGSHQMQDMSLTFLLLNQQVKDSGIYLIEDCHTAYWTDASLYGGPLEDRGLYNPGNIIEFAKTGIDVLNRLHMESNPQVPQLDISLTKVFDRVVGMHFYDSMIVFEMGRPKPFTRQRNSGTAMYNY